MKKRKRKKNINFTQDNLLTIIDLSYITSDMSNAASYKLEQQHTKFINYIV